MVQRIGICQSIQGTRVWSLVQEDPTCHGATKPTCPSYWTCAHNYDYLCATSTKPAVLQILKPQRLEPILLNKRSPRSEECLHTVKRSTCWPTPRERLGTAVKTKRSQKQTATLSEWNYMFIHMYISSLWSLPKLFWQAWKWYFICSRDHSAGCINWTCGQLFKTKFLVLVLDQLPLLKTMWFISLFMGLLKNGIYTVSKRRLVTQWKFTACILTKLQNIMVNKRVRNAVLGCNLKNDRMISVHFQGKPFNMVIQVPNQ